MMTATYKASFGGKYYATLMESSFFWFCLFVMDTSLFFNTYIDHILCHLAIIQC